MNLWEALMKGTGMARDRKRPVYITGGPDPHTDPWSASTVKPEDPVSIVHVIDLADPRTVKAPRIMGSDMAFTFGYWMQKAAGPFLGRIAFPARPKGYTNILSSIGSFVVNTATAHRCRLRGDIMAASVYESIADRIYQDLPDYAKDMADGWEGSIFP